MFLKNVSLTSHFPYIRPFLILFYDIFTYFFWGDYGVSFNLAEVTTWRKTNLAETNLAEDELGGENSLVFSLTPLP